MSFVCCVILYIHLSQLKKYMQQKLCIYVHHQSINPLHLPPKKHKPHQRYVGWVKVQIECKEVVALEHQKTQDGRLFFSPFTLTPSSLKVSHCRGQRQLCGGAGVVPREALQCRPPWLPAGAQSGHSRSHSPHSHHWRPHLVPCTL